ncbi:NUDIX hydrolase [Planktotalea arctica]|uniref:NUDIX hydrolase n=1 Tax=Planktotalea arctica TaxID=1481893 RepID=UPI00321AA94F
MIRRFGTPPKSGVTYRNRPGAYAILIREGKVLLTFQEEPIPEFQIPGGGIDPGESLIPALRREVMEETGWSIGAPVRLGAFRQFVFMPEYDMWANKLCHIFLARPAMKIGEPTERGHHANWVSFEQAPNLIKNVGDQQFLLRALDRYCQGKNS